MKPIISAACLLGSFVLGGKIGVASAGQRQNETHRLLDAYAIASTFNARGQVLDQLNEKYQASNSKFFVDLAEYSRLPRKKDDWTGDVIPPRVIIALSLPQEEVLANLLPILQGKDDSLREVARGWLPLVDGSGRHPVPNFDSYRSLLTAAIENQKGGSLDHFIDYMFSVHPDTALRSVAIASSNERRDVQRRLELPIARVAIWAARRQSGLDVDEARTKAVEELGRCARDERWWVRLYVARTLANEKELQTPRLVEILANDPNYFVDRAMRR